MFRPASPSRPILSAVAVVSAFLVCLASMPPVVDAQQQRTRSKRGFRAVPDHDAEYGTVDVTFGGGTLLEYVEALKAATRAQTGNDLNVVLNDTMAAREVPVPPIALKKVSLTTSLDMIGDVASSSVYQVSPEQLPDENNLVYVIKIHRLPERPAGRNVPRRSDANVFEAFPLGQLAGVPPEAVLRAVEVGLDLFQSPAQAQLKYHPESGLLLIHGTGEHVAVVRQIVDNLGKSSKTTRSPEDMQTIGRLDNEVAGLKRQLDDLLKEREELRLRLQEMNLKMIEEGAKYSAQFRELQEARAEIERLKTKVDAGGE